VDAGDHETAPWLQKHAPQVQVLESDERMGPGGGRNRLLAASSQPYVASLDDDSHPLDADYFSRVVRAFDQQPEAGMLAAVITLRGENPEPVRDEAEEVALFTGCGCVYRIEAWNDVTGYIPRAVAYGLEEVDLALQLLDEGWDIVRDCRLRIRHDTNLTHHDNPEQTASTIVNTALLPYIRYPKRYWPWGVAQYLNKIRWFISAGRTEGIRLGIRDTIAMLWACRGLRNPVDPETLRRFRELRE
jgi:GT2 family glycosyltransferase